MQTIALLLSAGLAIAQTPASDAKGPQETAGARNRFPGNNNRNPNVNFPINPGFGGNPNFGGSPFFGNPNFPPPAFIPNSPECAQAQVLAQGIATHIADQQAQLATVNQLVGLMQIGDINQYALARANLQTLLTNGIMIRQVCQTITPRGNGARGGLDQLASSQVESLALVSRLTSNPNIDLQILDQFGRKVNSELQQNSRNLNSALEGCQVNVPAPVPIGFGRLTNAEATFVMPELPEAATPPDADAPPVEGEERPKGEPVEEDAKSKGEQPAEKGEPKPEEQLEGQPEGEAPAARRRWMIRH